MADLIDAKGEYFIKDPDSTLDFVIDWAAFLGTDTISTSTWIVPVGITQASASNTTTKTLIWLSGGTAGVEYEIVNRILTAGGRTEDRSLRVKVIPFPALAANALIDIPYLKTFLKEYSSDPQSDVDNTLLGNLIDSASNQIETYCRRVFKAADYVERVCWGSNIGLKQYPVQYMRGLHRTTRDGLLITNGATKDYATASVSSDRKLYLQISGGTNHGQDILDLTLAANDTLSELIAAIIAIGKGWSASLSSGRTGLERSEDLVELSSQTVGSSGTVLALLDVPEGVGYAVDAASGILCLNVFQSGYQAFDYGRATGLNGHGWVKYRAGYDVIPPALQSLTAKICKHFFENLERSSGLQSERMGDYSYSRFDSSVSNAAIEFLPADLRSELEFWAAPRI